MNLQSSEQLNRFRNIPLSDVMLAAHAQSDQYDKAKWHTAKGVISITGVKFFNWNHEAGGGGAIDLTMHLHDMDFRRAVTWLRLNFPQCNSLSVCNHTDRKTYLNLPAPDNTRLSDVKHYLSNVRHISMDIIKDLIRSGQIYADNKANAVFLLRGKQKMPVGAELRGTGTHSWRGMAPGSRINMGCFFIGRAQSGKIILCESAIDAISCFIIHSDSCCISTAGARAKPSWLPDIIKKNSLILCGFDDDHTGNLMADKMIRLYPQVKRLRPPLHDWNDLLISST